MRTTHFQLNRAKEDDGGVRLDFVYISIGVED